jgi:hypothetical protein
MKRQAVARVIHLDEFRKKRADKDRMPAATPVLASAASWAVWMIPYVVWVPVWPRPM